jgi:hypothetical protein
VRVVTAILAGAALAVAGTAAPSALAANTGGLSGSAATDPIIGVVTQGGEAMVKCCSLGAGWDDEYAGVSQIAVAYDSGNGPLIAVVTTSGDLWVKEGSLNAGWNTEYAFATQVAVAGDPFN